MALDEAKFSQHMDEFVAQLEATDAFKAFKFQQVNVLKENLFPLCAVWCDRSGESGNETSDGTIEDESTFWVLVAIRLQGNQKQHVEIGKYAKLVMDIAETFVTTGGGRFVAGGWDADNGANEGDGSKVWAAIPVSVLFERSAGAY